MTVDCLKKSLALLAGFCVFLLSINAQVPIRDRLFELYGSPSNYDDTYLERRRAILALYDDDYLVEAMKQTDSHLASNPDAYLFHGIKADILTKLYDRYKGAEYLAGQIARSPSDSMYYLVRGIFLYENHFFQSAADDVAQAIILNPNNASAYYYLYLGHAREKRFRLAAAALKKAVGLDPKNHGYRFRLGKLQLRLNKVNDGLDHLSEAVRIDPQNIAYIRYLGEVFIRVKEPLSVAHFFKTQLKKHPQDDWLINRYVSQLIYLKQQRQAAEFIDRGLELYPDSGVYYQNKGYLHLREKNYADAVTYLLKSLTYKPDYIQAKLQLYRAYWGLNQYKKAEGVLTGLNRLKVGDLGVYIHLSRLYNFQNRIYSAEDVILNGLEYDSENPYLLFEYSRVLFKRKRFKEAISILKGLAEQFEDNNDYIGELGIMYYKTNAVDLAEKYLNQVADTDLDRYKYYLAHVLYAKKNLPALYELSKLTIRDNQIQAVIHYKTAELENDLFQTRRALGSINKALVLNSTDPAFLTLEAEILGNVDQPAAALNAIKKITAFTPIYQYMEIRLLLALKKDDAALKRLKIYNGNHTPEIFTVLAEDYLTDRLYFNSPPYQNPQFKNYYEALMRNASYKKTLDLLKRAPDKYRAVFLDILNSKFLAGESAKNVAVMRGKAETPTRDELMVRLFAAYHSDTLKKSDFIDRSAFFADRFGENWYVSALRADVLLKQKKYAAASKRLIEANRTKPTHEWVLLKLAFAYDFLKKPKKAEKIYHRLLKKNPTDPLILNNLAWLYITTEDSTVRNVDDALKYINKAIAAQPRSDYLDTKAEVLYQKKKYADALILIEQALAFDNSDADHFKKQRHKILDAIKKTNLNKK